MRIIYVDRTREEVIERRIGVGGEACVRPEEADGEVASSSKTFVKCDTSRFRSARTTCIRLDLSRGREVL